MARTSRILGPDGQKIDLDLLFGPPVAAAASWHRSPVSAHPADGLLPARLSRIHRAADLGDPRAYLELAEDIEEREPQYLTVLGTRRRQVQQLPITVLAATDDAEHERHAAFLREWLQEGMVEDAVFDMLDAISKGFSVHEITWVSTPEAILPMRLEHRPARWFSLDQADGEALLLEGTTREPLAPHKFIVHRHRAKSGLTIRSGLARAVSYAWMYKAFTSRDWAMFVQNYGQPMRVGRFDQAASEEDKRALWEAVSRIGGDCAAIVPKGMDIEFVSPKEVAKGGELYLERARYLDQTISKLVLGQTTTTDAVGGGHAVAKEHRLVQEDIERADARLLERTLSHQLAATIIALNFGPQTHYPRLKIGRPDEAPLREFIDGVDKLVRQGLRIRASDVRARLQLTTPEDGDEVIGGTPAPAAQPPAAPPAVAPQGLGRLRVLTARHASAPDPAVLDKLEARIAADAAGAIGGLLGEVQAAVEAADDLADLAERLAALDLDGEALGEAMARAMALAHLAGQAALLDELDGED